MTEQRTTARLRDAMSEAENERCPLTGVHCTCDRIRRLTCAELKHQPPEDV